MRPASWTSHWARWSKGVPVLGGQYSAIAILKSVSCYLWTCVPLVSSCGTAENLLGLRTLASLFSCLPPPPASSGTVVSSSLPTPAWWELGWIQPGCSCGGQRLTWDRPHAWGSVTLKTSGTRHGRSKEITEERKNRLLSCLWARGPAFPFCEGCYKLCSCSAFMTHSLMVLLNSYEELFVWIKEC